ncbi:MAG TPA: M55 family metallopeptidase [Bryobacterales bacterium]|nr:M55 family metallopeptidase [Bryobacterales bacterium]
MIRSLILLLAAAAVCAAQGPRIFIVTDMEGVGGVNNAEEQLLPGQRRYDESRRMLTGEVNAAVAGAFDAGASEVVIWDGHDSSRSLSIETIDARAKLIQGEPTPPDYYLGPEMKRYGGIMFVGQHPMAGAKNSILAHSQSFSVQQITINGKPVGELGQTAAIAGYFGIPVIFLSGDQAACDEMLDLQPKAETVAVKRLAGQRSSLSLSHAEAVKQIRERARRAVQHIGEFQPWKIDGPVEMKIEYYPETAGGRFGPATQTESRQTAPRTVIFRGRNVLETFQAWMKR